MKAKAKLFSLEKKIFSIVFSILITTFLSNGTYAVEMGTNSTTKSINVQYTVTENTDPDVTEEYCLNNPSAEECKNAGEPGSESWCLTFPNSESCKDAGEPGSENWCLKFPNSESCKDAGKPGDEAWCKKFPTSTYCKTEEPKEGTEEYCLKYPTAESCKDAGEPGSENWCRKFPDGIKCSDSGKPGSESWCLKFPNSDNCKDAGEPGSENWCRKFPGGTKCPDSGEPGSESWCLTFPGSEECKDAGKPGSEAWCKKFPKSERCAVAGIPNTSGNIGPFDKNSKSTSILLPITVFLGTTFIAFFIISKIKKTTKFSGKFNLENAKLFKNTPKLSKILNPVLVLSILVGLGTSLPSLFLSSFRSIADNETPITADTPFTEGENPFGIRMNLSKENLSETGKQGEFKTISFNLEAVTTNPTGLRLSTSSKSLKLVGPENSEIPSITSPLTASEFQNSTNAGVGCSTSGETFYPLSECLDKETEEKNLTQTVYLGIKTVEETTPGNYTLKDASENPLSITATTNNVDSLFASYVVYFNSNADGITNYNLTELAYTPVGKNFKTIPYPSNVRPGWTFLGWNTKPDGTGVNFDANETYYADQAENHLYAQWQKNNLTFHLTYYANGGSETSVPEPQTVSGTSANFTISNVTPTRKNYTFQGWGVCRNENTEIIQNTPFDSCPDGSTLSVAEYQPNYSYETTYKNETWTNQYSSLFAIWQENDKYAYSLTYKMNDGTTDTFGEIQKEENTYATSHTFTLEASTPTRAGYTFLGWDEDHSVSTPTYLYQNSTFSPESLTLSSTDTQKVLYAIWEKDQINYFLNFNNGQPEPEDGWVCNITGLPRDQGATTKAGSYTFTISPLPSCEDYVFAGWTINPGAGASAELNSENTSVTITQTTLGTSPITVTLTANWTKKEKTAKVLLLDTDNDGTGETYNFVYSSTAESENGSYIYSPDNGVHSYNSIIKRIYTIEDPQSSISEGDEVTWKNNASVTAVNFEENFKYFKPKHTAFWFYGLANLATITNLENLNTSETTDMRAMFGHLNSLTTLTLPAGFGQNATYIPRLFEDSSSLQSIILPEGFGKSGNMLNMFFDTTSLTSLTLPDDFASNSTDLTQMFYNTGLTTLTLPKNFGNAATTASGMFKNASNLTTIYVSEDADWSSRITNSIEMFKGATSLVGSAGTIYDESHVDASYAKIDDSPNGNPGYFTDKRHKIHFNANGGTDATKKDWKSDFTEEASYTFNFSTLENPEDYVPTKAGSIFLGWSETENPIINNDDIDFNCDDLDVSHWPPSGTCTVTDFNSTDLDYPYNSETGTFSGSYESTTFNSTKELYAVWGGAYNYTLDVVEPMGDKIVIKNSSDSPYDFDISDLDISSILEHDGANFAGFEPNSENHACPTSKIFYENGTFTPNVITLNSDCQFLTLTRIFKTPKALLLDTNSDGTGETLNFVYDGKTYAADEVYSADTIKAVFDVPYTLDISTGEKPDWYNSRGQITTVNFEDGFKNFQPESTYSWFMQMTNLTEVKNLKNLDASQVTVMENMFFQTSKLTSLDFSESKDFGKQAENMDFMFSGNSRLNSIIFPENFGVNANYTESMFSGCSALTSLTLPKDFGKNATFMKNMFRNASSLTTITLPDGFGQNATSMESMFSGAKLTSLTIPTGFGQNATNMNSMFANMTSLTTIYVPDGTDWSSKTGTGMFTGDTNLTGGAGTTYDSSHTDASYARVDGLNGQPGYFTYATPKAILYNNGTLEFTFDNKTYATGTNDISQVWLIPSDGNIDDQNAWHGYTTSGSQSHYKTNINKITFKPNFYNFHPKDTRSWFQMISSLEGDNAFENLAYLNTSYVENTSYMFYGLENLTSLTLPKNFGKNATNMAYMFYGALSLTTLNLPEGFGQNATNMNSMFRNAPSLTTINLPDDFGKNADNMESMFYGTKLTSLNLPEGFGQNAIAMGHMFRYVSSLTSLTLPDGFGRNATNMNAMFNGDTNLTSLNLPKDFGKNATDISYMFQDVSSLTSLNLPEGFGQNATNIKYIFSSMTSLKTIYAPNGTDWSSRTGTYIFTDDTNLTGGAGTTYTSSHTDADYAKIDGGPENPGYFTDVCEKDNTCAASPLGVTTTSSPLNLPLILSAVIIAYLGVSSATGALIIPRLTRKREL